MAQGPDPNRHFDTDRELTGDAQRGGDDPASLRSTRLGMSSVAIAVLAVIIAVVVLVLLL